MAANKLWIFVVYIFISVCQAKTCVYNQLKTKLLRYKEEKKKKIMLKER